MNVDNSNVKFVHQVHSAICHLFLLVKVLFSHKIVLQDIIAYKTRHFNINILVLTEHIALREVYIMKMIVHLVIKDFTVQELGRPMLQSLVNQVSAYYFEFFR